MRPIAVVAIALLLIGVLTLFFHASSNLGLVWPSMTIPISGAIDLILGLTLLWIDRSELRRFPPTPLEVLSSTINLEFKKADGSVAFYKKKQVCIARVSNIGSYIEQGLTSVGKITHLSSGPNTDIQPTIVEGGARSVYEVHFSNPPKKGQRFDRLVQCNFIDSFPNQEEYFGVTISHVVRDLSITIDAHPQRPFKDAWLVYTARDVEVVRNGEKAFRMARTNDGRISRITLVDRYPALASRYRIWWRW